MGWLNGHSALFLLLLIAFAVTGSRPWDAPYHPVDAMWLCLLFVAMGYVFGYVNGNAKGFRAAGELLLDERS